ncbi:AAA family ATPase [Cryobacterium sp. BB307]|uniref:AAA family ATPase n=1 Tax=Cryobacterium sp. BB307 TaxID=2716317 RepID=UPI0014467423
MIALVWLVGASGVGKTVTGWALQQHLSRRGISAAFVDADQLRNAVGADVSEDELIAAGLGAVEPAFRDAGATVIIVSGIVDNETQLERLLPDGARARTLVVHLHASGDAITERVQRRNWNVHLAPDSVAYAARFDGGWADISLDTTKRTVGQLVEALVEPVEHHLRAVPPSPVAHARKRTATSGVTIVTGPGGVGLSTAGFLAFLHSVWAGERGGYIDSHQVGFLGAAPRSIELAALRAANTAALVQIMAAHGIPSVLVTADPPTARELMTQLDDPMVIWLDASAATLESRLHSRAAGGGPPLAGDHRLGLDEAQVQEVLKASTAESQDLAFRPAECQVIPTDGKTAEEVAQQIRSTAAS